MHEVPFAAALTVLAMLSLPVLPAERDIPLNSQALRLSQVSSCVPSGQNSPAAAATKLRTTQCFGVTLLAAGMLGRPHLHLALCMWEAP